MIELKYNPNDMRNIFFIGDELELQSQKGKKHKTPNLEDFLNKIPSHHFLPSFKGTPTPEIFLKKKHTKMGRVLYYCHSGLWRNIQLWCQKKNIVLQLPEQFNYFKYTGFNMSFEEWKEYVNSWEISLCPYEYQYRAAWLILKYRQSLSQLATRAGKTLVAYMVFRYLMEKQGAKKILMIVPAKSLVKQAVGDFTDYAEFFKMETVWAGGELQEGSNLTIGTFQSLVMRADKTNAKYDPHFFDDYDVILVDEAHTLKCKSINTILEQPFIKDVKVKFGFSGSLPPEDTIESFCCHALMGPTIQDIRSKELMDGGYITPIDITQIYIPHPMTDEQRDNYIKCAEYLNSVTVVDKINGEKVERKLPIEKREFTIELEKEFPLVLREMKERVADDYDGPDKLTIDDYLNYNIDLCKDRGSNLLLLEQMVLHRDQKRLEVLRDLLNGFEKNCIVFAHHTSYLKYLHSRIIEWFPDRPIYLITGQTSDKKREQIKEKLLNDKAAILVASYGCVGTGLTFKNLDYGVFAQSFKSPIINKQSLGRGLCLANDKEKYYLYDLVDDFPTGKLVDQGRSKYKLFKSEKFDVRVKRVS